MNDTLQLKVDGEVEQPRSFTFADLEAVDPQNQIVDVREMAPGRQGDAVTLAGIAALVRPKPSAAYIGLHASADNFHASIPLAPVADRAILIYRLNGAPLTVKDGGPVRFFITDSAACHTDEIDECANVKFIDHIEFTAEKGYDNRPQDDQEHEKLHRDQQS